MTKIKFKAAIEYDTNDIHPDEKNRKDLVYSDIYTIDTDYFYGDEDIEDYIKNDLALVAGGGYATNTIENVKFIIERSK